MAALLQDVVESHGPNTVKEICDRLRLSNQQRDEICWLVERRNAISGAPGFAAAKLKRLLADPLSIQLIEFARSIDLARGQSPTDSDFCREYREKTPIEEIDPVPLITGDDLINEGLTPGPHFKFVLDAVRDAQLNGEIATRDEAVTMALSLDDSNS